MSTPTTPEPGTPDPAAPSGVPAAQPTAPQPTAAQPTAAQPTVPLPQGVPAYAQQHAPGQPQVPGQQPAPGQPAAAYGAPVYRPAAPAPAAAPRGTTLAQTNTYALLAIILAFISPIAGVVFGHMSLSQIKRTGDAGRGLAITGLVLGYASFAFLIVFIVLYIGFIALAIGGIASEYSSYSY
ncbi:DUF4190 domain-containing protein [Leucobacter chromiireducens]|uniref:DUF4190 domain-containing protein n=1 Tax=Leucobacter chromiireducens TaxID=283877 RepID=UPI001F1555F9|nr:DUF4190 domain-containing protein [Leucobacter chromiireducens]